MDNINLIDKNNIFSEKSKKLIVDMSICMDDLINKILLDIPNNYTLVNNLFELLVDIKIVNDGTIRDIINKKVLKYLELQGIIEDTKEYFICDSIRHAFINFKEDGIFRLYKQREAEDWYPKVIINNFIGIKEDIDKLSEEIVIYRGTSKDEYNSSIFGQSWTTKKDIAHKFAFQHYEFQKKDTLRVLLTTRISKKAIFFYKLNDNENEVVINTDFLIKDNIEILEEKII